MALLAVRQPFCKNQNAAPGLRARTSHCYWLPRGPKRAGASGALEFKTQFLGVTGERISPCSRVQGSFKSNCDASIC